jgi:CheY-like chemotaxis protein
VSLVLVIDDNEDIRETLSLLLEDAGCAVLTAPNGREALGLLRRGPLPDVVILDLMMPVMSGWELREEMLRDPAVAPIPTIVMTGDRSWSKNADRLHAAASLAKPFEAEEMLSVLDRVKLGRRSEGGS